jgi:hypothetical protein
MATEVLERAVATTPGVLVNGSNADHLAAFLGRRA